MKRNVLFALFALGIALFLSSCKKINKPTELGDELLPAVDNVNTFDTTLNVLASYHALDDTTKNLIYENMALGQISDPVFGNTTADMYFNVSSSVYGSSPFTNKNDVKEIDSVVLSLAYVAGYGDTSEASLLNVAVSEINIGNEFNDTTVYPYHQAGFPTGSVLGSTSFSIPSLKDTVTLIRKTDTTKAINVLRIRLDNSLGQKLSQYDTADNGAYKNDSLFRATFRGLAVKTTTANSPGTLAYFNLTDAKTVLTVYFKVKKDNAIDTASATFVHSSYSQANSIVRTASGEYLSNIDIASPQQLYIQSSPSGSYASVYIPGLTDFPNKVIHRAELIAYRLPSVADNYFTPPALLLDHKDSVGVAHLFDNDIQFSSTGSVSLGLFGGTIKEDSYRFNITRYVQGLVTRNEHNDTIRLYAPLRSDLYSTALGAKTSVSVLSNIAQGRVVLAGDNYPDPALRLRLRIVYSNL